MIVFFCVLSAVISACSAILALRCATRAEVASESLPAKLRGIPSRIESLENSVSEWSQLTTELGQRVKMMRVRAEAKGPKSLERGSDLPDPHSDPEGWRKEMNKRLAMGRVNGGTSPGA